MASGRKKQDEKNLKLLRDLAAQPHNKVCFDCGQRGPTYVNMTIGSFVCTSCSGILRGLNPPHRVKSISMTSFTQQEIETLQGQGNEYCRKVWLGLWNSSMPAEPESRDEQKKKDFMVQKYERKRWYVAPQQVSANNTSQSTPEPKPLKQLLGENAPTISVHAQTTRERPRTGSQINSSSVPVSVAPPPGQAQPVAHQVVAQPAQPVQVQAPAPQAKPPSIDLLSDLGGDPFDQTQTQGQFATTPQFDAFGAQPTATGQNTFDPFGSTAPQPAQPTESGFATFGGQQPNSGFAGGNQIGGGFGNFVSGQQSSYGAAPQPGWGGMSGQQQMAGGQNVGMASSSPQQTLSFGGAGMSAMAWTQFGKMGGSQQQPQQPQIQSQMNFGGNQTGFAGNSAFGAAQSNAGFGSNAMSSGNSFGGQPQVAGFGTSGSFGGQPSSGFGNQGGGGSFGGSMSMMGAGQSGQQQQLQQFGSWQQSQQANPFMNTRAQGIQRQGQSTNPFM
ncbi:PREDICTED: arf-GAP domain and FG repeat-containing protein 2-like [Acropora digitifera]|uniref:arf-GAP domain and FG repeat-containing protein 2-like n=1 Tax=Acropora digitifera TaxID=70779 RepID=UPI00077ACA71|nr:PREDICTED: arf-GAP domain and FG repeat-containing protein 2-like [Acropora digitifera]